MMDEPSLLDLIKSYLDPRREPIRLEDLTESGMDKDGRTTRSVHGEGRADNVLDVAGESRAVVSAQQHAAEPESLSAGTHPEVQARVPWRAVLGLLAAFFGQQAFEPLERQFEVGVLFYSAAGAFLIWAYFSGEIRLAAPRTGSPAERSGSVRWKLLGPAFFILILAFFSLGGNRFTASNLILWLGGLLLFVLGLWNFSGDSSSFWPGFFKRMLPPYRLKITGWHLAVAAAIGLVLFFRFYRLGEVPAEMFSDHAEKLQDVQDILRGNTRIFFPRNTGREFVQMYLTAFTAQILGYDLTFMALKMGTALAGLLTLPYIYLLGRELANRAVGLIAMVLAGISYWLNVITRVALRFSLYPLFVAPTLYYLIRGLRRGNRNDFILAGIFLGLGLHGYSPFRFVPIMVVILVALFVVHNLKGSAPTRAAWHLSILSITALIVFLPLLRFITESDSNMSIFTYRSLTRITDLETAIPGNPVVIFFQNMWRLMVMFAWDNGATWVHSVPSRPALDVLSAPLFYMGYLLLVIRYAGQRRWEDGALLLSVPLLVLPSALSIAFPAENPSLNRTGGAIVPVFIICALTLESLRRAVNRWLPDQSGQLVSWAAAGTLLAVSAAANYNLVFNQYDEQFRASAWNTTELGGVIRGFAESVGSQDHAWVIPWPHWVDTRLVGINAGVYIRDFAIPRDRLAETALIEGPKLFLLKPEDEQTLVELYRLYPGGIESLYISEVPGKDFIVFLVPGKPELSEEAAAAAHGKFASRFDRKPHLI